MVGVVRGEGVEVDDVIKVPLVVVHNFAFVHAALSKEEACSYQQRLKRAQMCLQNRLATERRVAKRRPGKVIQRGDGRVCGVQNG